MSTFEATKPTEVGKKSHDGRERLKHYKGFVAGLTSGVAKLIIGHPFDTIKVRLQTNPVFSGPLSCLVDALQKEGVRGLYKGATPPLVGWVLADSLLLGSLTLYRTLLHETLFLPKPMSDPTIGGVQALEAPTSHKLPALGHAIAGVMAGVTVSFLAGPVEHIKCRLQVQYQSKANSKYHGPIDCVRQIYRYHGIPGIYHGLCATLIFRSFFFFWWGSYDIICRLMLEKTKLSTPAVNFWAGGLSSQVFWLTSYPLDVVKQRKMTDALGGGLKDGVQRFPRWVDAARAVYKEGGVKGYWRGFLPCFLRAFPANAAALLCFETAMRQMP